ncbi:MAG: hypothetical protein CVU40_12535 [Chloroflexi bacterium HGW-Chloroflexi-2]|nr:MAG: hypothetical protein CVU40_12535 [Chloroflexi bacterium HGW-Chloroflexi-2]
MNRFLLGLLLLLLSVGVLGGFSLWPSVAHAENQPGEEEEYQRITNIVVEYVAHEWWLVRWKENEITCRFLVEHTGWPTADEVETWCGKTKAQEWLKAKPCTQVEEGGDVSQCPGAYLSYFQSYPGERSIEVELPLPQVWLAISNCEQTSPENTCTSLPNLQFIGEELLANEFIIRIQGTIDGQPFSCPADMCDLPLWPTGRNGVEVEFWADSSFGDSSEVFSALVRVQPWGDFTNPEGKTTDQHLWYVDVISSQWRGSTTASCSETWQVFPEIGGPPPWLLTPDNADALYTNVSFYYLAGMLISSGQVDASFCPDNGLNRDLIANACGIQEAYSQVVEWQNIFNDEILAAANESGVPAQLLKNVFSRESQFWPGIYSNYREAGLGQMTDNGADTVLLWNPSFFHQFCPLVLSQERCDLGFGNISKDEQAMMRGALVTKVNSTCPDCPVGIDLSQANFSVRIFAEGLKANCEQVGKIIRNTTSKDPGKVSNYEDLWRFTLVNYNAGSGCLSNAMQLAYRQFGYFTWENVSSKLEPACIGAIEYVEDITVIASGLEPTPTSWVQFATPNLAQLTMMAAMATATPTFFLPEPTQTPTPTSVSGTPQPTATLEIYPVYPTVGETGYPEWPTPGPTDSNYP